MNKIQAKRLLASAGKTAGVVVQIRAGKGNADEIRVLNSSRKEVLASGTIALDASKKGYRDSDLKQVLAQVRSLNASRRKMNCSENNLVEIAKLLRQIWDDEGESDPVFTRESVGHNTLWYKKQLRRLGYKGDIDAATFNEAWDLAASGDLSSCKKMNCSENDDPNPDDFNGDDSDFVNDVEAIVTDDQGNEVQVDEMLVVQDPETSEIALFIPTDEDEQLAENFEVIGEVLPSDDTTVLDSSRRVKSRGRKMNASKKRSLLNASREPQDLMSVIESSGSVTCSEEESRLFVSYLIRKLGGTLDDYDFGPTGDFEFLVSTNSGIYEIICSLNGASSIEKK